MKYSILINQKLAYDNKLDLDIIDLAIFEYVKDFCHCSGIQTIIDKGKTYYWISYQKVIDDMPILGINKKDSIYRRIKKLIDQQVLEEYEENAKVWRSYFAFGPKYDTLVFKSEPSDINPNPPDEKPRTPGWESVPPPDEKSDDNRIIDKTISISNTLRAEQSSEIVTYGNPEINNMLLALKNSVGGSDFKESRQTQGRYAKHLLNLGKKIGKEEFSFRLREILQDDFKAKNCNKIAYLYGEMKSFIHSPVVGPKKTERKSY